jgi:Protein of unknown function (DUF1186)/SEC-C motif
MEIRDHTPQMETVEILQQFERFHGKFERGAVEAAVAHRDEVIPGLLWMLEYTIEHAVEFDAEGGYMAHLYAMFLLAQFRETRAYPLVVRFSLLPSDLLGSLCGDFLTENLGQVMASVCGGELEGIQSVVENESADEYARCAAITALTTLVAAGVRSRGEIVSYFAQLFRGKLARKWSRAWDELVACTTDLYPLELFADIEQAYAEGLVDPHFISLENVKRDLARGKDWALAMLAKSHHRRMVMDTVKEMGWWNCFEGNEDGPVKVAAQPKPALAPSPIKNTTPKTGRNEPCPCGSGKKYKKCCGG